MFIDDNWTEAIIIVPYFSKDNILAFSIQVFYTHAIQRRIIQFHSSLIDMQGRGLMFIGPSGIGKTTQAELWNRYRDAPDHQRGHCVCAGDGRRLPGLGNALARVFALL